METTQKLQINEFSDPSLVDTCYGLSNPGNVGVNEEKLGEVLYPIPEDEDFEGEILDWDSFEHQGDNLSKLKVILDYATEKNKQGIAVKLNMPKEEVIEIDTTDADSAIFAITHQGLNGFYLQGNGCTFLLNYQDLEWRGFLYLENGGDVHLQNFTVDYAISNAVTGIIKSYNKEDVSVTIEVNSEFNEMMERLQEKEGTVCSYLEYTKATKLPRQNGNYLAEGSFSGYSISGDATSGYELTICFNSTYQDTLEVNGVGNYANVAFSYYEYNCLHFVKLGDVYVEGVTMHQSPAMGIAARYNKNIYINRFELCLKEGSNRLMTSNADAVHIVQDRGDVQITNSLFEYSQDDALNLKAGYWYNFSEYDIANKQITITMDTQAMNRPTTGDVLEVYDRSTFEKKASLTVVAVEGNSQSYVITVEETLEDLPMDECVDCAVANTSSAKLLYENNIVRNKRNRGILVMAQNPEIKNNTFLNVAHGSMLIWGVLDRYNEATVPQNVTIKNNKFMNGNYEMSPVGDLYIVGVGSQIAPSGTIQNIAIENNFFTGNGDSAIFFGGVSKASINNNLFYETTRVYRDVAAVLRLANAEDIEIANNYGFHSKPISGIYLEGTTEAKQLLLKNNPGLEIGYTVKPGDSNFIYEGNYNKAEMSQDGETLYIELTSSKPSFILHSFDGMLKAGNVYEFTVKMQDVANTSSNMITMMARNGNWTVKAKKTVTAEGWIEYKTQICWPENATSLVLYSQDGTFKGNIVSIGIVDKTAIKTAITDGGAIVTANDGTLTYGGAPYTAVSVGGEEGAKTLNVKLNATLPSVYLHSFTDMLVAGMEYELKIVAAEATGTTPQILMMDNNLTQLKESENKGVAYTLTKTTEGDRIVYTATFTAPEGGCALLLYRNGEDFEGKIKSVTLTAK